MRRGGTYGGGNGMGRLIRLAGQGVELASGYREHRMEQKQARSASQQEVTTTDQEPSASRQLDSRDTAEDAPPAYADVSPRSEISFQSCQQPTSGAKLEGEAEQWEDDPSDANMDTVSIEDDVEDWELDEALDPSEPRDLSSYEESGATKERETVDDLVREVIAVSSLSRPLSDVNRSDKPSIPYPVVIPQRRPRTKARGFVRAYAPVLEDCGIDEKTFLKFLKNFHKSSQASPIFPAVQIAAAIAGMASPSAIAMAVCAAVEVGAQVGAEVQARSRTNNFLDRMNEELFKPAGLYAMIIKYKSDAEMQRAPGSLGGLGSLTSLIRPQKVDFSASQSIAKYTRSTSGPVDESGSRSMKEQMRNLRAASGTIQGAIELPEAAPLIFPEIDHKLSHDGPETFKDKTKDAKKFLASYLDRRAQMQYAKQNPASSLTVPDQEGGSKYAFLDLSRLMHSSGLVSLVSGDRLNPLDAKSDRGRDRGERYIGGRDFAGGIRRGLGRESHESVGGRFVGSSATGSFKGGSNSGGDRVGRSFRGGRGDPGVSGGAVKRLMREDVLYLLIVNMPSETELRKASEEMRMARGGTINV